MKYLLVFAACAVAACSMQEEPRLRCDRTDRIIEVYEVDAMGRKHGDSVTYVGYLATEARYDGGQLVRSIARDENGVIISRIGEGSDFIPVAQ